MANKKIRDLVEAIINDDFKTANTLFNEIVTKKTHNLIEYGYDMHDEDEDGEDVEFEITLGDDLEGDDDLEGEDELEGDDDLEGEDELEGEDDLEGDDELEGEDELEDLDDLDDDELSL